ncbi:serine/threonine-protein kinase RIO2 [Pyrofollis japonicus]|uniref:RIO1 family regulatory kinase/ATPase domain-containing protein n=1 Tax=Pyrofollis japonicus TaxID=3060460 RepID=UPI00295BB67D|nr:RIO1 family regulatory kinase/ATPase [Pyrofollis japonicus]BEP18268.1 serine/threonine-protein kinase RIO2 [Pyrofollis japonicus]
MVLIALTYKKLVDRDFKVLAVIEREMSRYEYVPVEVIERRVRMPSTHVAMVLQKLNSLKLVRRRIGEYVGYRLTYLGLDMLALRSLVERGLLSALGDKLGVGKESDVYSGLTPAGERVIVKFHRVGRTSFQRVVRVRHYAASKPYSSWFELAKVAGQREFRVLEELYKVGALVPKPIGYSRHVVVTEYIEGVELYLYENPVNPESMLYKILETLRKAYLDVGVVHGDLSEYNVLVAIVDEEELPYIIDWPQYVEREHPAAEQLLRRDVEYITRFFRKKYRVQVDAEKALRYIRGEAEELL